jgi:hypothetical protein
MLAVNSSLTIPLLGGFFMVCACSGNGDRIPADTTASATVSEAAPPVSDTMPDTSRATESASARPAPADTPPAQTQSAGVVQAPRQKPIRPSIDPGRKAPPATPSTSPAPPAAAPATPASAPSTTTQGSPLKYDAASNTVTFELIGGPTGFQFNGHASGSATLTVPPKANIVMNFVNKDGTPHSAEIISGEGALPNAAVDAAIPRAYTNKVLEGLPQEGSDVMRFQAPESGTFRIFCGVPGHGLSGMWIWMKVDPAAKTPSFGPTKT